MKGLSKRVDCIVKEVRPTYKTKLSCFLSVHRVAILPKKRMIRVNRRWAKAIKDPIVLKKELCECCSYFDENKEVIYS